MQQKKEGVQLTHQVKPEFPGISGGLDPDGRQECGDAFATLLASGEHVIVESFNVRHALLRPVLDRH